MSTGNVPKSVLTSLASPSNHIRQTEALAGVNVTTAGAWLDDGARWEAIASHALSVSVVEVVRQTLLTVKPTSVAYTFETLPCRAVGLQAKLQK